MKQLAKWIAGLTSPACNLISEGGKRVLLVAFPESYILANYKSGEKSDGFGFWSDYQLSTKGRPFPTEGIAGKVVYVKGTFAFVPEREQKAKTPTAKASATEVFGS